ncbi:hypothetical protein L3X38_011092 [Prunus dulcis]|uniref:Uncharacterized protein n=1 Tax=Prunus dulcis TaxID=3755 RepID=A0AAD4WJ80_PRUDU|nr:hypothetical protein L3X38_011092 [Prunus dulcis]
MNIGSSSQNPHCTIERDQVALLEGLKAEESDARQSAHAVPKVDAPGLAQEVESDTGGCVLTRGHNTEKPGYFEHHDSHNAMTSQHAI